jgi:integrase
MKEALGRRYAAERTILRALDTFLTTIDDDLTRDTFVAWNATLRRLTPGVRRNWLHVVRNLCLYRRRTLPDVFMPDPTGFPKPHAPIRPYITTTDIARLLDAADHLVATSRSPLRRETFRLAIVLLYTSGLRRGELVRLTVGDYDSSEQTLLIRASKFHKSRRLPLSSDAQRELEAYLRTRRHRGVPTAPESALIWNRSREEAARIRVKRCDARSTRSSAPRTFARRPRHGHGSTTYDGME